MHEISLLRGLLKQIEDIVDRSGADRVKVIRLKVGPLAHIEPEHLRAHFTEAVQGTRLEDARLEIETTEELHDITLETIDAVRQEW